MMVHNPSPEGSVWALPRSLAATSGISVDFSSSGYLDVSVQAVPLIRLCIQRMIHDLLSWGFPHSEISGSITVCVSPELIAACHVLHRLPVPRHPPCALNIFYTLFLCKFAYLVLFRDRYFMSHYSAVNVHRLQSKQALAGCRLFRVFTLKAGYWMYKKLV